MGKYKRRFNERARAGTLSKQKKLRALRQPRSIRHPVVETNIDLPDQPELEQKQGAPPADSNRPILVPVTDAEREARRAELEQLFKQPESKYSKQKQRRLDKYIERQLKRDEKKIILEKLASSKIDTSVLHSLQRLGSGKETRRELLQDALLNEKLGILDDQGHKLLYDVHEVKDREQPVTEFLSEPEEMANIDSSKRSLEEIETACKFRTGFGFGNIQKKQKGLSQKLMRSQKVPYNWRSRLQQEQLRKIRSNSALDNSSEDEPSESDDDSEISEDEESFSSDAEWTGFDDKQDMNIISTGIMRVQSNDQGGERDLSQGGDTDGDNAEENEEDDDSDSEEDDDGDAYEAISDFGGQISRGQSFKDWAETQLRGGTTEELSNLNTFPSLVQNYTPVDRPEDRNSPPPDIVTLDDADKRRSYFVNLDRDEDIQSSRLLLPVVQEEQRIMEAINNNLCVVICGETGSGKTTQVPQFLLEAGYGDPNSENPGLIGITQPRRVAAISMAKRVATEVGNKFAPKVAYQIRFEQNTQPGTAMKFMTDGVLLRELAKDLTLSKYSAIIIDEAHERNVNTDILIGVLSRVLKLRLDLSKESTSVKPLRLVIMSATLRVSDFAENATLFSIPPPVLKVEARQFSVAKHFSRRTAHNYIDEAFNKISKIHKRLPPGGILVFMTGQNEITQLCRRLKRTFAEQSEINDDDDDDDVSLHLSANEAATEAEDIDLGDFDESAIYLEREDDEIEDENPEEVEEGFEEQTQETNSGPLHVLPLYSLLPTAQQMKIFDNPPGESRLCVVATNVAETSLTIPGIRYVVDCGRVKERKFDKVSGVQRFDISWISKASADQRAGRAGRTGPGHCYRLYSSAVYESEFPQFSKAEILRMPIDSVVLQLKSMAIDTISNFPFPTPPEKLDLFSAERLLEYLGAIAPNQGKLTTLGRVMCLFPLAPRFAKMIVISQQFDCLPYMIAIVAGLSVGEPFLSEIELTRTENPTQGDLEDQKRERKKYYTALQRFSALDFSSDVMRLLSVICAFEYESEKSEFCFKNFLHEKLMDEIHKLRQQLTHIVSTIIPATLNSKLGPPSEVQQKALKQMVAAGFIDQVAVRADLVQGYDPNSMLLTLNTRKSASKSTVKITDIPYLRINPFTFNKDKKFLSGKSGIDKSCVIEPPVYIHPTSGLVLFRNDSSKVTDLPAFLVYSVVQQSSARCISEEECARIRIKPLTSISGKQLAALAKLE
ncbi:P-loop containing nucleoside triphosphate hydrolase protein [Lipomyces oligophaga]|uniref:P-loop containing nucleoside triphosphate hydrolase protein n=1 Tax=Lipomyces oligophaga TaxID=45792 RepID=UPI0034D013CC